MVVSRRHGGAVQRNRIRRRLQEAIRRAGGPPDGTDWVLSPREGANDCDFEQILLEIRQILEEFDSEVRSKK